MIIWRGKSSPYIIKLKVILLIHKFLFNFIPNKLPIKTIVLIRDIISIILMLLVMIPIAIICDNLYFTIIGSLVLIIIQQFTYSFHCKNLDNCVILTNCLFLVFGYISKQSVDYLWVVFLIGLFCIKDIYIKTPLKIIVKGKDEYWHKEMFIKWTFIFFLIAVISLKLNYYIISSCIMCSYIMIDLTLFLNDKKERL